MRTNIRIVGTKEDEMEKGYAMILRGRPGDKRSIRTRWENKNFWHIRYAIHPLRSTVELVG